LELRLIPEVDLPLTKPENLVKENDKLDLSKTKRMKFLRKKNSVFKDNSDLIACTVHMKEK